MSKLSLAVDIKTGNVAASKISLALVDFNGLYIFLDDDLICDLPLTLTTMNC